ncbi:MAG: hypothetical protein P4L82_18885 [Ancalomicrobiaceae bacterium]|nr:hypothetical protein [Ancalomicrobiaceae bacterium]
MAAASFVPANPAAALDIGAKGVLVLLAGPIKPGDSIKFRNFLKAAPAGSYHAVVLASGGGIIVEAVDIARQIRENHLATVVDAGHFLCASACTILFAGGTARYYLNANHIADGDRNSHRGLGFHDGNNALSLDPQHYSGRASGMVIDAYYEFGIPAAAQLVTRAAPNQLYVVSGETALKLGIATRLTFP